MMVVMIFDAVVISCARAEDGETAKAAGKKIKIFMGRALKARRVDRNYRRLVFSGHKFLVFWRRMLCFS